MGKEWLLILLFVLASNIVASEHDHENHPDNGFCGTPEVLRQDLKKIVESIDPTSLLERNEETGLFEISSKHRQHRNQMSRATAADSFLDPLNYKLEYFNLQASANEHSCIKGFSSSLMSGRICEKGRKTYVSVGQNQTWGIGTNVRSPTNLTFVGDNGPYGISQLWAYPNTSPLIRDFALKAIQQFENPQNIASFKPVNDYFNVGGNSYLERICNSFGTLPFQWTCSNKLNFLLFPCGTVNAFVSGIDYWINMLKYRGINFTTTPTMNNETNGDNVVYLCTEIVDYFMGGPVGGLANVLAHETTHVIQVGWGHSNRNEIEGQATFLEGTGLGLELRPTWFFGSATSGTVITDSFYSTISYYYVYQLFYSYISQPSVLGFSTVRSLVNRHQFLIAPATTLSLSSLNSYYSFLGLEMYYNVIPPAIPSAQLPIQSVNDASFIDLMANFRIAWLSSCLNKKPDDAKYHFFPEYDSLWLFPCWNIVNETLGSTISTVAAYLGADVRQFLYVSNPSIELNLTVPKQLLVVLAENQDINQPTLVYRLNSSTSISLQGNFKKLLVMHVNLDTSNELILSPEVHQQIPLARWYFGKESTQKYSYNILEYIQSPLIYIPANARPILKMNVQYDTYNYKLNSTTNGCKIDGSDDASGFVMVTNSNATYFSFSDWSLLYPLPGSTMTSFEIISHSYSSNSINSALSNFGKCNIPGWNGHSRGWLQNVQFDLSSRVGQYIRFGVFFSSSYAGYYYPSGLWVDSITLIDNNTQTVLFQDQANGASMKAKQGRGLYAGTRDFAFDRPYPYDGVGFVKPSSPPIRDVSFKVTSSRNAYTSKLRKTIGQGMGLSLRLAPLSPWYQFSVRYTVDVASVLTKVHLPVDRVKSGISSISLQLRTLNDNSLIAMVVNSFTKAEQHGQLQFYQIFDFSTLNNGKGILLSPNLVYSFVFETQSNFDINEMARAPKYWYMFVVLNYGSKLSQLYVNDRISIASNATSNSLALYTVVEQIDDGTGCSYNPCLNGGTCQSQGNSFTCNCQSSFSGTLCQIHNQCSSNPCQNRGICISDASSSNGYRCECPYNFYGTYCEVASKCLIQPDYCLNDGICIVPPQETSRMICLCKVGYTGDRCENLPAPDANVCSTFKDVCVSGNCIAKGDGSYSCSCTNGTMGPNCQFLSNYNPCLSKPCQSGRACTLVQSSFSCDCPSGYIGANCDQTISGAKAVNMSIQVWMVVALCFMLLQYL